MKKNIAWFLHALLSTLLLSAGLSKLITPFTDLEEIPGMEWLHNQHEPVVQLISTAEILGALGLIITLFYSKIKWVLPVTIIWLAALQGYTIYYRYSVDKSIIYQIILLLLLLLMTILKVQSRKTIMM